MAAFGGIATGCSVQRHNGHRAGPHGPQESTKNVIKLLNGERKNWGLPVPFTCACGLRWGEMFRILVAHVGDSRAVLGWDMQLCATLARGQWQVCGVAGNGFQEISPGRAKRPRDLNFAHVTSPAGTTSQKRPRRGPALSKAGRRPDVAVPTESDHNISSGHHSRAASQLYLPRLFAAAG